MCFHRLNLTRRARAASGVGFRERAAKLAAISIREFFAHAALGRRGRLEPSGNLNPIGTLQRALSISYMQRSLAATTESLPAIRLRFHSGHSGKIETRFR